MDKLLKLIIIIFILMLTGCEKEDDTIDRSITIATSHFTLGAKTDLTAYVNFSTNVSWTTSEVSYEGSEKGWLTITPTSGSTGDNQEIILTASFNDKKNTDRTAYLTINYGGKTHKLTITQSNFEDKDITSEFDSKFAAMLETKNYIPHANKIMLSDVVDITSINVSGTYADRGFLTSLAGIEYFTALTLLDCSYNQLTTLDITKNTMLTHLNCRYNRLTTLEATRNAILTVLECSSNQLTTLDVTKNTALTTLECANNQLKFLGVTKNRELATLVCSYNQLATLDITQNRVLRYLNCTSNQLTALDITMNVLLTQLWCYDNRLKALYPTKNIVLTQLGCSYNQLTSLDITKNTALTELWCDGNKLAELDVTKNTELTHLRCYDNQLTKLNVTKNMKLQLLNCSYNQLTTMDVSKNMVLENLWCSYNPGNGTKFVVTTWNASNVPPNFTKNAWLYNGNIISIEYQE